ncbi:ABC transporter permease [Geminicoccus flavidas]|uniref:ABC transporter permease n=1 Tax=Geminicoccus flavidas TaxID=2506407 RepID=UPI0013573DFF|nr:ABC transporter permease [Geminicoccus flavidas]
MQYRHQIALARTLRHLFGAAMVLFLLAPLAAVVPLSFSAGSFLSYPLPGLSLRWYETVFLDGPWLATLKNSLIVGTVATIAATVLGTLAAYAFARRDLPMPTAVLGFLIAPMIVPPVISGLGMYFLLAWLGLTSTMAGVIVAHTVLAAPFVLITVTATLQGFDMSLLRAAASLGASPTKAFLTIVVPVITPGIVAGALFAFMTSFDEVVVTLFLAGPAQRTLPLKMFEGLRDNIEPSILAMATFLMVIAAMTLIVSVVLMKKNTRNLGGRLGRAMAETGE